MPRYFFHFYDGQRLFSDTRGLELNGISAARKTAIAQVRDLKAAISFHQIHSFSDWVMSVDDRDGKLIFEIGFDLRPGVHLSRQEPVSKPAY